MWINVRVKDSNAVWADGDSCSDSDARSPGTFLPRQIDPRHVVQRQATQQCDSRVALVVQVNRFFKVEPPFPLDWRQPAWNSRGSVGPAHAELRGQFLRDVM